MCALQGKLPARRQLWGETLNPDKPSVAQNKAAVAAAAAAGGPCTVAPTTAADTSSSHYDRLLKPGTSSGNSSSSCSGTGSSGRRTDGDVTADILDSFDEDAGAEDDITAGQTWMVLEYCDKGCLQVRV